MKISGYHSVLSLDENNKMTLDEFRKLAPLSTYFIYDIDKVYIIYIWLL